MPLTNNKIFLSYESLIVVAAMLAVLIPLSLFAVISLYSSSHTLTDTIRKDLQGKSVLMGHNIDNFIKERITDISILSQADVLESDNITNINQYLGEITQANEWVEDIDVINLSGKIIASSGERNESDLFELFLEQYPSNKALFSATVNARQGQVFISEAQILDSGPGILLLTPITDNSNTIVTGVLTLEVNLTRIAKAMARYEKRTIGDKHFYVVDNQGRIIVSEDPAVQFFDSFPDLQVQPELLDAFSRHGATGVISYTDSKGDMVMAGYSDMSEFGENHALDWSIISIAPLQAVTRPVAELRNTLIVTGIIIALISGLLVYWLVSIVTGYLLKTATQADEISRADFSQPLLINIPRRGAFSTFVNSFNRMAFNIQKLVEDLKEREQNLFITLNSIADGVIATDKKGNVTRMNPVAEQLTGWPLGEASGKPIQQVFPIIDETTRETIDNPVEKVIDTGKVVYLSNHTTLLSRDGKEYQIEDSAAPIRNADNDVLGMVLIFNDVTERKQADVERQKFVMLADSSSEFIGMCDLEMKPHYVNPAGMRMVGLPDMEAACRVKVQDYFFLEDQRFIAEEFFPRVLRDGHGDVEIRLRHFQTGEPIWMFYYLFSVLDASGTTVGWATVSRDITEHKLSEMALRESERQLQLIANHAPVLLAQCDAEKRYKFVNQSYAKLVGLPFSDIVGKHTREILGEEAFADASPHMDAALAGVDDSYDLTLSVETGELRVLHVNYAPEYDEAGQVVGFIAAISDITERKQIDERLRKLALAVEQSPESIMITNTKAEIEYVNEAFVQTSGYSREEVIGSNPRILHSDRTSAETYQDLWATLGRGGFLEG